CAGTTGSPRCGRALQRPQQRAIVPARVARGAGPASMPALAGAAAAPRRARRQARMIAAGSWLLNVLDQTLAESVKSTVNRGHRGEAIERRLFECPVTNPGRHAIERGEEQIAVNGGPGRQDLLDPA